MTQQDDWIPVNTCAAMQHAPEQKSEHDILFERLETMLETHFTKWNHAQANNPNPELE